jgi:cyclopropane fatty-acyl-phospholipid synthase-like methyltransferase
MTREELIGKGYDTLQFASLHHELFFNRSGFSNFGYWLKDTKDGEEAGNNLVDKLLEHIPEKRGTILDVACGQGGTTKRLMKYFKPEDLHAINISENQINRAKIIAPGCNFYTMSASKLEFRNNSMDHIICVEAAFHFDTRERFFKEAYRVLKPGGRLVLSDIIMKNNLITRLIYRSGKHVPGENIVDSTEYGAQLRNAGFEQIEMQDACAATYRIFRRKLFLSGMKNYANVRLWPKIFSDRIFIPGYAAFSFLPLLDKYLLVGAKKPGTCPS